MKKFGMKGIASAAVLALSLGFSGQAYAAFEGFGEDIPLKSAASQIIPEGWSVDYASGVDQNANVSWSSASDWQSALKSAVAARGYDAQFGSNTVVITKASTPARTASAPTSRPYSSSPAKNMVQTSAASRAPAREAPRPAARPERSEPGHSGGGFSIRPYRSQAAAAPEHTASGGQLVGKGEGWNDYKSDGPSAGTGAFIVEEGFMLRTTLIAWAEATGWRVIWESEHDYLIEANASFGGDFVEATTALVHAMRDARPSITVDFYKGNNVVVISNKLADEAN